MLVGLALFAAIAFGLYTGISLEARPDVRTRASIGDTFGPPSASPDDWLATATEKRRHHDYQGARDAYSEVIRRNAMTADAWADYADTIASLSGGSLAGEAETAIQQALALDPAHPKALWLQATHAYQEHQYTEAVRIWKRLRAVLGPESPDTRIIDADITESEQLARAPSG